MKIAVTAFAAVLLTVVVIGAYVNGFDPPEQVEPTNLVLPVGTPPVVTPYAAPHDRWGLDLLDQRRAAGYPPLLDEQRVRMQATLNNRPDLPQFGAPAPVPPAELYQIPELDVPVVIAAWTPGDPDEWAK